MEGERGRGEPRTPLTDGDVSVPPADRSPGLPDLRLGDVGAEARHQLGASGFAARLPARRPRGGGVGSRGIENIALIVESAVSYWHDHGMAPFVFPAMGSHGAATPDRQADVLAHFGITEQAMGCPVVSRGDVVSLGRTDDGIEVFMDAAAPQRDGLMIVARVKWHTTFDGRVERPDEDDRHRPGEVCRRAEVRYAQRLGLEHVIRTVCRSVLQSPGKMIGGLAILEDAHHNTAKLDAVPAACMERRDEEHLALVNLDAQAAL